VEGISQTGSLADIAPKIARRNTIAISFGHTHQLGASSAQGEGALSVAVTKISRPTTSFH